MSLFVIMLYVSAFFGLFTSMVYLLTYFENRHNMTTPKAKKLLTVSVVVPAFNEEGRISKTVESVLNLNYPKELLEIILVDDGSKDNTLKEMKKFESRGVKVFSKKNGGAASAKNYGIERAKGEIVVTLDADSFVDKDALLKQMGYFENPKVVAVTPAMKVWKPKSLMQRIQHIEYMMGIFLRKAAAFLHCIHVTPGPFTAYRKSFFEKYGGFDVGNITEDMEIGMRIQSNNYIIENAHDAYSYTIAPSRFNALYKQRLRWYTGFLGNFWKYKHLISRKYGTLGLFYLPTAFVSVFFTLFLVGYTFNKLFGSFFSNIFNLWSINFDFLKMLNFKFDIFYLPTDLIMMITVLTLTIGTLIVLIGRKMSSDKEKMLLSYSLSLLLYAPLYALWWAASIVHKASGRHVKWDGVVWKKD